MTSGIARITPAAAVAVAVARGSSILNPAVMMNGGTQKGENGVYAHYNHTDPCKHLRWTARESHQYMHQRPWQKVVDFYSDLVQGRSSLTNLFGKSELRHDTIEDCEEFQESELVQEPRPTKKGRWERVTFKIVLAYNGCSFDGWQRQPGLNTVQGVVEMSLGRFVDEKKAKQLIDRALPVEPCVGVAGRTDKGVTALRQVCSFYTWRKDINANDVEQAVNNAVPGRLKALHVSKVSRVFHPNFSAKWRHYLYIFPLNDKEEMTTFCESFDCNNADTLDKQKIVCPDLDDEIKEQLNDSNNDEDASDTGLKPRSFSISKVNRLIQHLEGKSLSYKMFARDTKASRNIGPPTECYMFRARATEAILPCASKESMLGQRVMCVELVANRFLRKMVRVLVATAIREAAAGSTDEALLRLMDATCRRATAPPAPPDGLCLVDVGYGEFEKDHCLIR